MTFVNCLYAMYFSWFLCLPLVTGLNGGPYIFANESVDSPIISTTSGQFAGLTIRLTNIWIGIPYATPPVGVLRWRKGQPYTLTASENTTVRSATHYSPSCPQIDRGGVTPDPFDEDCLYLNVWAPRAPPPVQSKGYPVMFWIHGGGFMEGSATQAIFDGLSWTKDTIEANNSFIMVSIHYRLNVMGFFAQPTLLDDHGETIANQGITDQRIAMKWVQNNIEKFGGDKTSVTRMGQSAGSHSVCVHIISPLSAGFVPRWYNGEWTM